MNNYFIEKQGGGYVLVREGGNTVATGAPHMKSALNFAKLADAKTMRTLLSVDTFTDKSEWTPAHWRLFREIPPVVRDIAGDLFEIKWYQHANYEQMLEEVARGEQAKYITSFKQAYDSLTDEQKNLIYYAHEA